jgi:phi LC3 family holin
MINWKVRLKNKNFWLSLIPAVLLLIQVVAAPFGYKWDFGVLGQQLTAIVNAAFAVLAIVGVVTDPTTAGVSDSLRAMNYDSPNNDKTIDKTKDKR